ncbi:hypothetical protein [Pseudomonas fluorescens]|uniref:hypothetical protein n=1 Tax=Pseudomonas fluorescens TaxID=294 RepID=UPI00123F7665|nr:hypothetical protein [Pseudomonas fluorescens]
MKLQTLISAIFTPGGWGKLRAAEVLFVRHDANCGYIYQGEAYSPIIDTMVDICLLRNLSVQSIATPYSKLVGDQAYNSPVAFNRSFIVIALVGRVLGKIIGDKKSAKWVASKRTDIWLKILRSVKPKLVIGIQPEPALCRACRVMAIPVYDYQHGVIDKNDLWYGELLAKSAAPEDLPYGFLCWDQASAKVLQTWAPDKGATVTVVGHPWFQRFNNAKAQDRLVETAWQDHPKIFNDDKPVILVALQWGLHLHYYPEESFNKVMCSALESVIKSTSDKYNWLLRLHPVQLRGDEGVACEEYLSAQFSGMAVEWHKASIMPLPLLLSQIDLHITDMSTVVIEASWFGIPSALLNPFLNKGGSIESLYEYERESGFAAVVPQEIQPIISWIEAKLQIGKIVPEAQVGDTTAETWVNTMLNSSIKH